MLVILSYYYNVFVVILPNKKTNDYNKHKNLFECKITQQYSKLDYSVLLCFNDNNIIIELTSCII